jgi:triosephosphate isomerase
LRVFPPYVYLADVSRLLRGGTIQLGAQDVCAEAHGAYTGEVSAAMLKDVGCAFVIVGHSERRHVFHEDDALVARKFAAALTRGLVPVLCVGEQLSERESQRTEEVVARQLDAVLSLAGAEPFAHALIAYEPVWAIGTGRTASPAQVQEVHGFIRQQLGRRDAKIATASQDSLRRQRQGRQCARIIRHAGR